MAEAPRISAERLHQRLAGDEEILLVCAYDDRDKCEELPIDGSIPFPDFEDRVDDLDAEQKIAFY